MKNDGRFGLFIEFFWFCYCFEHSLISVGVLCYSNFRSSLGMRSTRPFCKNFSHSTYKYIGLSSPKFQLKFSRTNTLILACAPDGRDFSHPFPRKGMCWGQSKLGHNMPHFPNPVRLRGSLGAVAAAGALQSPGASPNSAVSDKRQHNTIFGHFCPHPLL